MLETPSPEQDDSLAAELSRTAALLRNNAPDAAARAQKILQTIPGQQQALALLVSAKRLSGDKAGAAALLRAWAQAEPRLAAVHYELGLLLSDLGERAGAIAALSRAVELEPQHPSAWRALGDQLAAAGRSPESLKAYRRHFDVCIPELKLLESAAQMDAEQAGMAEAILREALKISATDVSAMRLLGDVYMRMGRHETAEAILSQALALAPEFHPARLLRAIARLRALKWSLSLEDFDLLLADDPSNALYLNGKAQVLVSLGDNEGAIQVYEKILAEDRRAPDTWTHYGHALKSVGRQDDSVRAYRKALSLQPGLGHAYWSLANMKTIEFTPAEIARMRAESGRADRSAGQRALIHFALGKALEDAGDYAASFENYDKGNRLRRSEIHYNADATSAMMRRSTALFTPEFFAKRAGAGSKARDPIFIVGLPRSGSTLVEQILASHSAVEGTMELGEVAFIALRLFDFENTGDETRYPGVLAELPPEEFKVLGERYIEQTRVYRKLGTPRFVDKALSNFYHLGLIQLMLPNAKIIDTRRHPLGCGFSIFRQHFGPSENFFYDQAEIARYYRDYVELMAHFDAALPGRIHRVFYEDMVADSDREIRRLLDYCELPFEDSCLRYYETERSVSTASSEQVRQPIFDSAIERWKSYEPWLEPMKAALGDVLTQYPATPEF